MSFAITGKAYTQNPYNFPNQTTLDQRSAARLVQQMSVDNARQLEASGLDENRQQLLQEVQRLHSGAGSASTMNDANTISNMGAGTAQSLVQSPSTSPALASAPAGAPAGPNRVGAPGPAPVGAPAGPNRGVAAPPAFAGLKLPASLRVGLGI